MFAIRAIPEVSGLPLQKNCSQSTLSALWKKPSAACFPKTVWDVPCSATCLFMQATSIRTRRRIQPLLNSKEKRNVDNKHFRKKENGNCPHLLDSRQRQYHRQW